MRFSSKVIGEIMPEAYETLVSSRGRDFVERIGDEVVREVIFNVLCGRNLRDSTEMITRRRIGLLNALTLAMFVSGSHRNSRFAEELPDLASNGLRQARSAHARVGKEERWLLEWILGLTDKAYQNVLRDNPTEIAAYKDKYVREISRIAEECERDYGVLDGHIKIGTKSSPLRWRFMIQLLGTVGAQTLAIRGSEKSTYGKLFERLILGSVLTLLGFRQVKELEMDDPRNVFWLSERAKRESDATALCGLGRGVRFDIGFIGRGNPEITLDKVTRYEREAEFGRQRYYMATFIIVDRVGRGSRIEELAGNVNGTIIQMSMGYWPKKLAQELEAYVDHASPMGKMSDSKLKDYIRESIAGIDYKSFLPKTWLREN
jgi:hypothetical protein